MSLFKSRFAAVLALSTALTAPALIAPHLFSAAPAIAGEITHGHFADLAEKVTPAVVNVAVTSTATVRSSAAASSCRCIRRSWNASLEHQSDPSTGGTLGPNRDTPVPPNCL